MPAHTARAAEGADVAHAPQPGEENIFNVCP